MKDPRAEFEEVMTALIEGKRGLGTTPPDEASRFAGACLLALGPLFSEAVRVKAVDIFADVLAWELAVIATHGGPAAVADIKARLERHLAFLAQEDRDEGGRAPAGGAGPVPH